MIVSSVLLAFAFLQEPTISPPEARTLAWEWHQTQPSSDQLLQSWREFDEADAILQAAARGLRGDERLSPLLHAALGPQGEAIAPRSAILELLDAAPLAADSHARVRELQSDPQWREPATLALLRAGGDLSALAGFPAILETALGQGWLPSAGTWHSFLADSQARAMLWPRLSGLAVRAELAAEIAAIDAQAWPAGDRLLLAMVLADASEPTAESAATLWKGWLEVNLPEGAGVALQQALARHLPAADPLLFAETLAELDLNRRKDAVSMLSLIAPTPAAASLRSLALDPSQATDLRARAANAVFRCGSDADVQALAQLLHGETPQPILQNVLAGMRLRPAAGIATTLESMMPRLRTRIAGLAVELIVLTGSEEQRLAWLARLSSLPQSDQARIVQAAWAVAPSATLSAWFEEQAASAREDAAFRGRLGLQASRSAAEVAAFYQRLLAESETPDQRQAVLRAVRELRTDEALEVLVDWLATEEGMRHGSSAQWASLVIEEAAAERAFSGWWAQRNRLTPTQLDWAAIHLADQDSEARDHIRARVLTADTAVQVRMWTALSRSPQIGDAELALETLADRSAEDPVRTRAAALIAQLAQDQEALGNRAWQLLTSAAVQDPKQVERAWRALVRTWAETGDSASSRIRLRARLDALPTAWQVVLRREMSIGVANHPDPEAAERALLDFKSALTAQFAPVDRGAAAAEQALSTETPMLLPALVVLGAIMEETDSARLLNWIAEQAHLHPDALAISARTLAERAPAIAGALRARLRATESRSSWRFPPEDRQESLTAPWLLEANEAFEHLQNARECVGPTEEKLVQLALRRWPRDRRSHLWAGWYAWNDGRLGHAVRHFENAEACSGWLPYARMEPRLGLALTHWRTDGSVESLRRLLDELPQAIDVLPFRISAEVEQELLDELDE